MMIGEKQLCDLIGALEAHMLRQWVDAGLVRASSREPLQFDDADVARVHLICELHYELAVDEETLPVIVSLMDQLYALRKTARAVSAAIAEEPEDVRSRITLRALESLCS
jgi:chaperone modulatory protein CbpM